MVQWRRLGAAAAFGSMLLAMAACSGDGGRESATPAIPGVDLERKVLRIGALAPMFDEEAHFGNGLVVMWLLWSLAVGLFRCIGLLMGCTWTPPQGNAATAP